MCTRGSARSRVVLAVPRWREIEGAHECHTRVHVRSQLHCVRFGCWGRAEGG